jgi:hypothetical protein
MNIEIAPIKYQKALSWCDATLYCFSLNIDGKIGWRLPTVKEERWLERQCIPSSDAWYWTADVQCDSVVCYNWHSELGAHIQKEHNYCYARPVRDLKDS